jgi:hypothetical protein
VAASLIRIRFVAALVYLPLHRCCGTNELQTHVQKRRHGTANIIGRLLRELGLCKLNHARRDAGDNLSSEHNLVLDLRRLAETFRLNRRCSVRLAELVLGQWCPLRFPHGTRHLTE